MKTRNVKMVTRITVVEMTFAMKNLFCESIIKELRKKIIKCFVRSIVLYEAETRSKRGERKLFGMWTWRRI